MTPAIPHILHPELDFGRLQPCVPNHTKELVAPALGQMSENAEKKADVVEKGEEKAAAPQGSAVSSHVFLNDQKEWHGCKVKAFSTPLRNGPKAASQSHRLRPPQQLYSRLLRCCT